MPISVESVADPAYLDGLDALSLSEVRAKRDECQQLENALSYLRRLVHGRLDIVRDELENRRAGGAPADLESIIGRLPALLSEGARSSSLPRPPQDLAPGSLAESLVDELEDAFPVASMASVPGLSVDELGELAARLGDYEHRVSGDRGVLHGVIDRLQEELIGRYQTGDATVDSLLDR